MPGVIAISVQDNPMRRLFAAMGPQGRRTARRRAANRAIAEGDAKTLNDHYERTLNE